MPVFATNIFMISVATAVDSNTENNKDLDYQLVG